MRRVLFFLLLLRVTSQAQFYNLATTDDGQHLYFDSGLRMRGSDQFLHSKIFRYVDGRFELFAQEPYLDPGGFAVRVTNPFALSAPNVSGDGRAVSYVGLGRCLGSVSGCLFRAMPRSRVQFHGQPSIDLPGAVQLSRNGRYALQSNAFSSLPNRRTDLATGETVELPRSWIRAGRQAVASDGTVIIQEDRLEEPVLTLWNTSSSRRIRIAGWPALAILNDAATHVVYEFGDVENDPITFVSTPIRELRFIDLRSGREVLLIPKTRGLQTFHPSISNFGNLILYVAPGNAGASPQVHLANTATLDRRSLTREPEGIAEAVLSGNGNIAYAVTRSGRLLRIDVATGAVTELVGRQPVITEIRGAPVPGSLNWIRGT
ncbi:MAG: hypothetical protein ACT443_00925, partial [Gemmatimonadota bacterium]